MFTNKYTRYSLKKKKKKLKQAFLKCLQIFNPKKQKTNKQGGVH